ncbi:MAG TPA: hypothetical protein VE032_04450 [Actinomycetota bacterium]|nr:hypothetical protein [Actinomycetota bacterium]
MVVAILASVVASVVLSPTAAVAAPDDPGFVSVLFGRTQWVSTRAADGGGCSRVPNTVTLGRAHDDLSRMGIVATGVVIVPRTPARGLRCFAGYTQHPGWRQLERWHRAGWRFVSGGTHADLRFRSYEQQVAETCGMLPVFRRHGMDGSAMYAYADNAWSSDVQADPVARCFAYGRTYRSFQINRREGLGPPWFQGTHSVSGGTCNVAGLACYRRAGDARSRYDSPPRLAAMTAAGPGTWFSVQFYRFVRGAHHGSSRWTWDCRGRDWRRHYTSQAELYCYGDFLRVMRRLRENVAAGRTIDASPGRVARAWGRA